MERELEKDKPTKELKMLEIRLSLKNKFKGRREKRKKKTQGRSKRMTSAWKESSRAKCTIRRKTKKDPKEKKVGRKKWGQSTTTKRKRT